MALDRLMTVFELHDYYLRNLCYVEGTFMVPYGYTNPVQMRDAYPDRMFHVGEGGFK